MDSDEIRQISDSTEDAEAFSPGDRELLEWTRSLTSEEKLAVLQDFVDTFWTPAHG